MLDKEEIISAQVTGDGNIVIQNSDNTTLIIDTHDIVELRKQISNLQDQLSKIDPKILQVMAKKVKDEDEGSLPQIDANIYFGIGLIMDGQSRKLGVEVTITNLTKEHRYFSQPSFSLSHPINGADSFILTTPLDQNIKFPIRLEYGQPITVHYVIGDNQIDFFQKVLNQNEDASVAVVSSTTVGEIYRSNEYTISYILSSYNRLVKR